MEPRKRKAEVLDLTADDELASRPPKRPDVERDCVIDLSPTVVDLASDAEAAAAPANPCLLHKSLPSSPQVIDSDDDAPPGCMTLADGSCAALEEKSPSEDHQKHVRGTAATQGCPGPETPGNMNIASSSSGLKSGVQEGRQLSARASAIAPAVSAFFGQFAGAGNAFQAAAVLLAAAGKPPPPQLLQALLKTALQPPLPAVLQPAPRSAAAVQPSAAAAVPLPQPVQLCPLQTAAPASASSASDAQEAAPCITAGPGAAQPPQLQSAHVSAAPVATAAAAAEGARSEGAAPPVAGQLPHLRPVKVPSRVSPAQEGAQSDPALQAAAVSPSSAESSSGILLAPREASPVAHAAVMSEGNALDKPQSFTHANPSNNMGKAAPGQAEADSPDSSATESTLMRSPKAAGTAVCRTSSSRPSIAACGVVMGIVCNSNNSHIRPPEGARFGGIASITDRGSAALASRGLASADVDRPVSTPNLAPVRGPSAGVAAAAATHGSAAAGAPIAAAAPGRRGAAAGAHGLNDVDGPESAGITGVPGAERVALAAPSERVGSGSGAADPAAAAPRASAGPDSSATITDSDVAARADGGIEPQSGPDSSATITDSDVTPTADDGIELQRGHSAEVGVPRSSTAGAGSSAAGGLPRRIRTPPQRLEPTFHGKKHTMAAVGTSWTADDAWQASLSLPFLCWFL
ncbi:hypothetical protein COCOBI_12-5470 [Coccomyxa sp. Obi]|nr:hypothetical protein COCOBI_12-5470 [Coccomyxa sp. Obi]